VRPPPSHSRDAFLKAWRGSFGDGILEELEVHGRGICMVIKRRELRGEQFVSL